jgi:prepilin peptidase CpaA
MSLAQVIEAVSIAMALGALAIAALKDFREYRIPNTTVLCLVAAFVPFAAVQGSWAFVLWALAAGGVTFALCAALFALRLIGGGDAKLIAAMALWTQFWAMPRFFVVMALAGGVLAAAFLLKARFARPTVSATADATANSTETPIQQERVPYGVAIAVAGIDFFLFAKFSPLAALIG